MISPVIPVEEMNLGSTFIRVPLNRGRCERRWRQWKTIPLEKGKGFPLRLFMRLCVWSWGRAKIKEIN